ncbi:MULTISPECIES: zf-HC2 domain-containing protein [unclassified Streptomyces]|uniref:zf-HC2 domain-containing protein n=1 Tax=unclassified Streptomyces TaxID=2593676 RepID=UPI00364F94D9
MSTQQHPNGELLGAYVLGILATDERSTLEEHTAECEECRMELTALQEMEAALDEVPPEAFLEGPPEDGDLLLQRTLRQVRAEQASAWRRRSLAVGLGAAASAAILFLGGYAVGGNDPGNATAAPPPSASPSTSSSPPQEGIRVAAATDSDTKASMTVELTPASEWVRVNASVAGVPSGERCRLVVVSKDGHQETAASWVVSPGPSPTSSPRPGEGGLNGSAAVAPDEVESVIVVNDQGKQYVGVDM